MKNLNKHKFIRLTKSIGIALTLTFTSNVLNAQIRTHDTLVSPSANGDNIFIGTRFNSPNLVLNASKTSIRASTSNAFSNGNWRAALRLLPDNQDTSIKSTGSALVWDKGPTGRSSGGAPFHFFMAGPAFNPVGYFYSGFVKDYNAATVPIYSSIIYSDSTAANGNNSIGTTRFTKNILVWDGRATPINKVGIGLNSPTEQLHTTQGVRFAGLQVTTNAPRVVVSDATGRLSCQTIGTGSLLTTNCATTNYLVKSISANQVSCSQVFDNGTNVGIGTATPASKFHVNGQSFWLTGGNNTPLASTAGHGLRMFNDNTRSHLFSWNYTSGVNSASDMVLQSPGGNVGVNMNPGTWTGGGVSIQGSPANPTTVKLDVNGMIRSTFLVVVSDEKMKTNINNLRSSLDKILNLRGVSYNWKKDVANRNFDDFKQIGFIAQEVEKVLPEVVGKDENGNYAMNYQAIIPVLAEAIKEQNVVISELKAKIETLSITSSNNTASVKDVENSLGLAEMMQNKPNPFNKETTITCIIPETSSNSVLFVYDMQGKQIRKTEIKQKGKTDITIQANELNPGMYLYSLIVDGKEVSTKRMIITD